MYAKYASRCVLIHGDDVIGIFDNHEQALLAGWERSLSGPFLVKLVDASLVLEREYATYWAKLPELLAKDAGRYVLIHGDAVVGIFDTLDEAMVAGWERWLFEPFLVEKIEAEKKPLRIG